MIRLHVTVVRAVAAAALVSGILLIADRRRPAAQEPAPQGKPRPDAVAAAGRGSGAKNVIEGTDEDDRLAGGDAEDWIFGKKGHDWIVGGKGRDVIDAADGDDTIDGGADNDIIDGGAGNDTLRGGDGDDTVEGNDDDDLIDGGQGNDNADGGDGNDVLRGGPGDDVLAGGDGDDSLSGAQGNDSLSGNDGNDTIAGGAGNDRIAAGDGDDSAAGEAGDDVIDGGQGDDTLKGGPGNDTLTGSWGADSLDGGNDQDTLSGGDGRDLVNGGSGGDWLLGGAGADVVHGGDGDDIIVIRAGDVPRGDTELADGGAGDDVLTLNGFVLRDGAAAGQLTDPITGGTYRLLNIERVQHTHLVPHIGLDPARSTSLLLVNPSATEAGTGRMVFFGADGAVVNARTDAVTGGTFTIPPLGSLTIDAFAPQAAMTASAQVFANIPVGLAGQTASRTLGSLAASEGVLIDGAIVPIHDDQAGGSGVIITNSILRSRIKLTVYNSAGSELECCSADIELAPYAQRTVWTKELFPRLGDFEGVLAVESGIDRPQEGGPVVIVALQRRGSAVTASPAVRMSPGLVSEPLVFSSVTSGGDAASVFVFFNPSGVARARGTASFFDQQGRPWSVSVNRQAAAATVPLDLPPRGSAVWTLAPGGPVQTGSARVTTAEGSVGGVVRSMTSATVTDTVPATAATAFVAGALRDRASAITTDITITSTGSAATVQLALHDQTGAQVAGGVTQLRVPANGQVARSFDDLFPNVKIATVQGTIVATSDQRVSATVTRSAASGRTSLPLIPTR
jgi:Ca2+-binding RTX toxin-like protein